MLRIGVDTATVQPIAANSAAIPERCGLFRQRPSGPRRRYGHRDTYMEMAGREEVGGFVGEWWRFPYYVTGVTE